MTSLFLGVCWLAAAPPDQGCFTVKPPCTSVEVTQAVRRSLPFASTEVSFVLVHEGKNPGHGERQTLFAVRSGAATELKQARDLRQVLRPVESPEQALALARFISDPPRTLDSEVPRFGDAQFFELRASTFPGAAARITVAEKTLTAHQVTAPKVEEKKAGKRRGFVVHRWVVAVEQSNRLAKEFGQDLPAAFTELAQTEETIDAATGEYAVTLKRVPVKDFPVSFQLLMGD